MRLIDADVLRKQLDEGVWNDAVAEVDDMPTIEAVPVVYGEWIIKEDEHGFAKYDACSVCGYELNAVGAGKKMNFCPGCCAKMKP